MRKALLSLLVVVVLGLLSAPAFLQEKGGDDRTGPYDVVPNWPGPLSVARPGNIWGSTGGIFAETPNRVFIANRGELKLPTDRPLPNNFTGFWGSFGQQATGQTPEFRNCIVIVDANGKVLESWTQWDQLFEDGRGPHSVLISPYDPEHNVWVVDDIHHQIFKFTNDGKKLLMTLGIRDEAGNDSHPLQAANRHRVVSRRDLLRQRRVRQHALRQVRQERKVPGNVGNPGHGSQSVQHTSLHHGRQEPSRVRRRSREQPNSGVR